MERKPPLLRSSLEKQGEHIGGLEVAYSLESSLREGMERYQELPGTHDTHHPAPSLGWSFVGIGEPMSEELSSSHESAC